MTAPRLAALVVLLLAVVGVLTAASWLPAIGEFLVVSEPLAPADAIVVLAGNAPARCRTPRTCTTRGWRRC